MSRSFSLILAALLIGCTTNTGPRPDAPYYVFLTVGPLGDSCQITGDLEASEQRPIPITASWSAAQTDTLFVPPGRYTGHAQITIDGAPTNSITWSASVPGQLSLYCL